MTDPDHTVRTRRPTAAAALTGAVAVGLLAVGSGAAVGMSAPAGVVVQPSTGAVGRTAPGASPGADGASGPASAPVRTDPVAVDPAASGNPGPVAAGPAPAADAHSAVPLPVETSSGGAGATGLAVVQPPHAQVGGAGAVLPAAGTYTYDTTGSSRVTLVGSDNLPDRTRLVVTTGACGVTLDWRISAGNGRSMVECPAPGGLRVASETLSFSTHGYSDTQTFRCGADAYIPVTGRPGRSWQWDCSDGATVSHQTVILDGARTVEVGGVPLSAEEVSVDSTLSGAETGTVRTVYLLASNGLPVHEETGEQVGADGLTYQSRYVLDMSSLQPF